MSRKLKREMLYFTAFIMYLLNKSILAEIQVCEHGISLPDGTCDCYSCWHNDFCNAYASRPPRFVHEIDTVMMNEEQHARKIPVYTVEAIDPDDEFCKDPEGCPCSRVTYFIANQEGNAAFLINNSSGEITLDKDSHLILPRYELKIGASDDGVVYDTMTLIITTGNNWHGPVVNNYMSQINNGYSEEGYDEIMDLPLSAREKSHHRQKRAVSLPNNVTFTLSKYGANENVTEIKLGHRIQFKLDILFPSTPTDIQVELFTPDSNYIVMMLCNVRVTVGSSLVVSGNSTPVLESLDNSTYNDRAIIQLGTVTNNPGSASTLTDSTITILYEAVMVENSQTVNQDYYVSAGAEFNNENDVWVGQASFTANITNDYKSFPNPIANITGPPQMPIGSSAVLYMDLKLFYPQADITLNMYAPVNISNAMSICNAKLTNVNEAYQCGLKDLSLFTPQLLKGTNTIGNQQMQIALGKPVNKLAREYSTLSQAGVMSFSIQITLFDDTSLIGKELWVGATVMVSSSSIWAGQLKITATAKSASGSVTPAFNVAVVNGTSLSQTRPAIVQIDMIVPENTAADYFFEAIAPFNDSQAIYQVCALTVWYGENIACASVNKFDPQYIITANDTFYTDIARVDLGRITNLGSSSWNQQDNVTRNTVRLKVLVKATNHSMATVGSNHDVYFGMFVGVDKLTIGKVSLQVSSSASADAITTQNTPSRVLSIGGSGNDTITIGKTGRILLDVQTARNTIYSPFDIEFIMPNNSGDSLGKICKVQLVSVGLNNPCVIKESIEKSTQLISSFNGGIYDRAILSIPSLCNYEVKNDTVEDHFLLALNFILRNNSRFVTDTKAWISAGLKYSPSNLWVGQIAVYASFTGKNVVNTAPYMTIVSNNGNLTKTPLGYVARYYAIIKLAPNVSTPLALNISTLDNALSICDVRLSRFGEGFPCLDTELIAFQLTQENKQFGLNQQGYLYLGYVENVGNELFTMNSAFDANTLELEIVTKLTPDVSSAADGSLHMFKIDLNYNSNSVVQSVTGTVTTTIDISSIDVNTLASAGFTGNMSVISISGTDEPLLNENLNAIVKSESKRIAVDVNTPLNSTSRLSVTASTTLNSPNVLEVIYIGLFNAGSNLPCVKLAQTTDTYQSSDNVSDFMSIAVLDLGYVCNTGADTTNSTANRLRVEIIVRLFDNPQVTVGQTVSISASVKSNNQQILVYTVQLTVGDANTFTDVYSSNVTVTNGAYVNTTENPIVVPIAATKTLPIVLTVPAFSSSRVWFDAIMPVNTSAIMTLNNVKFVQSGRNIPLLVKYQGSFVTTKTSQLNTSQITKYETTMGVVSNGGMMQKFADYTADDDTFTIEVTMQMADHALAVNGSSHKVSFGIHVANVIFILDVTIVVLRTGKESLIFNVSSVVNDTTSTNNRVEIETILRLSNMSTAEGQNTVLNMFLPQFVSYITSTITSNDKSIIQVFNANNAISIELGTLFFTDVVCIKTVLEPNTTYLVPLDVTGIDVVFSYQPVANTIIQNDVTGDLDYLNFTITTKPESGTDCTTGPLGMEAQTIKDCQLSASDFSITEAVQGRYNLGTGWSPFIHTGKVKEERFFQVYFGNKTIVSKIKLQQLGDTKVKLINLRYSNDGQSWSTKIENMIQLNQSASEEVDIPSAQTSRFLRVMILASDDDSKISKLKFEFIGCVVSSDKPSDPCASLTKAPAKLSEFSRRSLIKAGLFLYVCDGIQSNNGIQQKCFSSNDDLSWTEIDSRVGEIIGYDSAEPRLFGVSANGLHYLSSADGTGWYSSVQSDISKAKALSSFQPAIQVPVNGDAQLSNLTPAPAYITGVYGATNEGVKKNSGAGWQLIYSWSTTYCC
ncbi:uncharacterized protein LOC131928747 [Physella acuta]|uniref:uncharacterized protein LOC131928747 n=1 Tax=Physella acuta TaxID=109671 RepID=UPI0027DCA9DC|nr:uncharacterized protein LOC131928747 [Physella acuta]